jgi:hypothetical protein
VKIVKWSHGVLVSWCLNCMLIQQWPDVETSVYQLNGGFALASSACPDAMWPRPMPCGGGRTWPACQAALAARRATGHGWRCPRPTVGLEPRPTAAIL